MPNHVDTLMTVEGFDPEIQRFIDTCIVEVVEHDYAGNEPKDKDGSPRRKKVFVFDFNTIIPCPPELENTVSPTPTEKDYESAKKRRASKEELNCIRKSIELARLLQKKYGYSNWYDFKRNEWGTKWGAYDYSEGERSEGRFVFRYNTAWSPADPIMDKLRVLFPILRFTSRYIDEGWSYYGEHEVHGLDVNDKHSHTCDTSEFMEFANKYFDRGLIHCSKCKSITPSDYADENGICESCLEDAAGEAQLKKKKKKKEKTVAK